MIKTFSTNHKVEKAILVALITPHQSNEVVEEYLDELAFLGTTLGVDTVGRITQKLEKPEVSTFVGKGKLEEIQEAVISSKADMVIFDDDLSPSQLRNLERKLKVQIYDRSLLILDIFRKRAQTSQAKTQVELARYQYLLPRLTRMWTHLERQRGGTGTRGGAGEKEIETDRRNIRNQINVLKQKLIKIEKQSATQRKSRSSLTRVAIVGYTNAGKSTLMQLLSKANVKAEDKLFATVDSTVRKVVINRIPFLLSDTVGFIRKLPSHLIESFKSTLDEVRESDILLHVVDVSNPAFEDQMAVVKNTLVDLGSADKPTITVFNKIDRLENSDGENHPPSLEQLKQTHFSKANGLTVFISASEKRNIQELRDAIYSLVKAKHLTIFPNFLNDEIY